MNLYERAARAKKAALLVEQLDADLIWYGLDPENAEHCQRFAGMLQYADGRFWAAVAERAGVRLPSETTQAWVVARYRERARELREDVIDTDGVEVA